MAAEIRALDRMAGLSGRRAAYALLALDLAAIGWVVAESFLPAGGAMRAVDLGIGLLLAAEFVARIARAPRPLRELATPAAVADAIAIAAFLLPSLVGAWGFLRVLRTLRLLRSARVAARLRRDLPAFRRNEEAAIALLDFAVFLVVTTGLVFGLQGGRNPQIANWADALYFTVTALTTTGFGDITLEGTSGRLLTVAIMLTGVTLFLRLAQALFRPAKVRFRCPTCALLRHEPDAVHCKACGTLLDLPDEGP